MGSPSGGRGPSRERDINSTGRSGSRKWGGEGRGKSGGRGGGDVGQQEQWEGTLATQPDRDIEVSQNNRGVGGVCVGVVPRVQSKL